MTSAPPDYYITEIDYLTLPTALLDVAKQHLRVDFDDDDQIITRYIASAIDHLEQFSGWRINPASVAWSPVLTDAYAYATPLKPIGSHTVMAGDPPQVDVSTDYVIVADSMIMPWYLMRKDKTPFHADATITLVAGFTDIVKIPPRINDVILRITGTLYENRESVTQPAFLQLPSWWNDVLSGIWIPRA